MLRMYMPVCWALVTWSAASGAEPIELQPAGPWRIDYADESCLLSRPFAGAGGEHNLVVTFEPLQGKAWLRLSSPGELRHRDDEEIQVAVDDVPLSEPVHMNILKGASSGVVREFLFKNFWGQVADADMSLRFRTARHGDIQLNVSGLPTALKSVETCVDDLHSSLGIEPALLRSIKSWPEGFGGRFIEVPLRHDGDSFTYRILYWVGPDGNVDECRLLDSTRDPKFDASACDQLKKKGKFVPARNFAGAPVRAPVYENSTVRRTTIRR